MTRKTPRSPDRPETRERLLDAAERLFAERGFTGTSVREITDAAKANLGAINYHFRSKEDLYREVFARRVALLRDPVVAVSKATVATARRQPDKALLAVGQAFLAPHQGRESSARLLALFAREMIEAYLPPGLLVRELLVPMIGAITAVMSEARPDLPEATARACADSFLAQLKQIMRGLDTRSEHPERRLEHAVRFTVAALRHIEVPRRTGSRRLRSRKSRR